MAGGTRERILDAAERLFAERGFMSISLRDITTAAGVNLAAVNYHFGSKEALLEAVLERRIQPVNRQRLALLDEMEARTPGGSPPLSDLVAAFISPPFQSAVTDRERRRQVLKLVGQIHAHPNPGLRRLFVQQFDEVRVRFTASFQRALPDLDPEEVDRRAMYIVGALSFCLSWGEQSEPLPGASPERLLQSLIDFSCAGMMATVTTPPAAVEGDCA